MPKVKPTTALFFFFTFFLFTSVPSAKYIPLLWERPIYDALNSRDGYFNKVGITHDKATLNMLFTPKGSKALKEQLELNKDESSPWYHFLSGIVNLRSSDSSKFENFSNAIGSANNNPGVIWVLFLEFYQTRQGQWADSCLTLLEKHFLSIGAQSAPIISQQLLAIAKSENEKGNNLSFRKYVEWSARFEQYPFWQIFMRGLGALPQQPQVFVDACKKCITMIRSSWLLQLTLLYYLYRWLWLAFFFFITILFITLSIEMIPIALHPIAEIFPSSVSPRLKNLLTGAMFVSLSVFGIIPFFLIATFIYWPYVQKWKKAFLVICFFSLALSPINPRIQDLFRVSLSLDTSLGLFRKVTSEGWHTDLENRIMKNLTIEDSDYLSHTSAAILDLKKESISTSTAHILNAEKLKINDPVILTTAGNIYYAAGDFKLAKMYYKKCVETYPDYAPAKYNLGLLNFYMKNPSESSKQMAQASDLNPDLVNNFNEKNAHYFIDTLPLQRQFLQPDYSPNYFWRHVFPSYWGSWEGANKIWGFNSLGVPPLLFPFVVLLLIVLLFILAKLKLYPDRRRFCKLCGSPLCKKCRIGQFCRNCVRITESTHEEAQKKQLKLKMKGRKERVIQVTTIILNLLFPGAGELYRENTVAFSGIILIIITSCFYATYVAFFTFDFSYPFWVAKNSFTFIFFGLLLYNLFFAVVSIKDLLIELQSGEGKYVISWKS